MTRRRASVLARKALELTLRQLGVAPEVRQAKALVRRLPAQRPSASRVLVLSPRDWAYHVQCEAMLAHALQLRGADVLSVTCGGGLALCDRVNTYEGPPQPCRTCRRYTDTALAAHGFDPTRLTELADEDAESWPELDVLTVDQLLRVELDGLPLGSLVQIPARWFLCNSDLHGDPLGAITLRRMLRAGRRVAMAMDAVIGDARPDVLLVLNGMFFFESIAAAIAAQRGIRVVSYERGFIHGTLVLAHGPVAATYDISASWPSARDRPLGRAEDDRLDRYLARRRQGLDSHVRMWEQVRPARLDDRPRVAAFSNVTWDSAALSAGGAFTDMASWVVGVIDLARELDDVDVILRVHPAEITIPGWRTREPVIDSIVDRAGPLPQNLTVVPPDDPLDSYELMMNATVGTVFTSTTGLELALMGTPVVCAGRPHYAGKGFTIDVDNPTTFKAAIGAVLREPGAAHRDVDLARRYANHFFFEVPVRAPFVVEPVGGLARLTTTDASELLPGANDDLDRACRGILEGAPFWP